MTILQAVILGIIEGITEFLPVSSTAHLILSAKVLGIPTSEFLKTFEIVIQLGAILAVAVLYKDIFLRHWEVNKRVVVAFLPTVVLGAILYPHVKDLLGSTTVATGALLIGGVILIIFERMYRETPEVQGELGTISYKQALTIGLAQSVAMVPGVSRSAATIVGGMLAGLRRETIVEFSFLLAVPTMVAASGLDLLKNYQSLTGADFSILTVGFFSAFASALFAVSWLLKYVQRHTFTAFGIYRIIAALLFWWLV